MGRIRVYLADRHVIFRKGIRFVLSKAGEIEVIGETSSNEEAFKFVESNLPNVVILNVNDNEPNGLQITRSIQQNLPSVSVVLVTDHEDEVQLFSAIKSGASAFITKDINPEHLVSVVKHVAEGDKPIGKALLRPALARCVLKIEGVMAELSVDEANILIGVAEGTSGELLAGALGISERSLNLRLVSIITKLIADEQRQETVDAVEPRMQRVSREPLSAEPSLIGATAKEEPSLKLEERAAEAPQVPVAQSEVPEEAALETSIAPVTPPEVEAASASKGIAPVPPEPVPAATPELVPSGVWENVGATKLIDSLFSGKVTGIAPEINLALEDGFTYPEADITLGTSGRATLQILESLADEDVLVKSLFARLLLTPEGSPHMIPQEYCPHCDSNDIVKGQFMEHSDCGHVGLESGFEVRGEYVCPKCKRKLSLTGTDYRKLGIRCRCNNCHEIIPTPVMKFRSLRTGKVYARDELQEVGLNSYRLSPSIEFQLNSKARQNQSSATFFCYACLEDKPIGQQSPDPRYCQRCCDFLLKEATRRLREHGDWIPKLQKE